MAVKNDSLADLSDLDEFQRTNFNLIVLFFGFCTIAWQVAHFSFTPQEFIGASSLNLVLAVAAPLFYFAFSQRSLGLAGAGWMACMLLLSAGAAVQSGNILPLLAAGLLALAGSVQFGWVGGAAVWAGMTIISLLLPLVSPQVAGGFLPATISTAAGAVLGVIFRHTFISAIDMYYHSYRAANLEQEELRRQRVEFKQVEEDLLHANQEMVRLTRQLKVLNQAADEARRAKETFVATVSHELRTPLNMIIGFSEVIAQSPQVYGIRLPSALLADIASIRRNSQHLLELVNDVLDLSQVDMGNLAVARDWCSLATIVNEALEVIRPLYHSKNLYLNAELPDEDPRLYCDQTRIREVIVNLLSNAGRFTDTGGVTLRTKMSSGRLLISVTDTGPGISADNLKRLFEPFQQLDSSIRRKHGGSGLGLAISKRFVEMHGGEMWMESVVDQGTTVWFSLPVEPDAEAVVAGSTRWVNPAASVEGRWRPFKAQLSEPLPRFVVMEEGGVVRQLFQRYMDDIEVTPVASMDEAVAVLGESPAQMLVINHPRAEELLHSIGSQARLPFGLPVMAFWLPGGSDFADSLGAARYLVKPVSQEMLLEAVKSVGQVHKVLLVDDNPEILQLYGRILSGSAEKYRVLRASSGQQGLDLLRQHKPDVMILDLIMPEMNGFQVLQAQQADPALRAIPVVLITAQDPSGLPRVSEVVTLTREGGFSVRSLLDLAHSIGVTGEGNGAG